MTDQPSPRTRRRFALLVTALTVTVAAAAVFMLFTSRSVFMPRTLVMATGPEGSAYREFGLRYRAVLARAGLDLRLLPTAGAVENLSKLHDPRSGVTVAFVEAGTAGGDEATNIISLGTVFYEPLWFFLRGQPQGYAGQALKGKRVSIGPEGSGTRVLARRLFALNGLDEHSVALFGFAPEQAATALLGNEIDAAFMVTSWRSPAVRRLLIADGIMLASYPRADAYIALFPDLSKLVLPTGVADLTRNIPPADVTLLAVQGSLAVRRDLPSAVQYLLLEAASEIHGGPGVFHKAGRFPASEAVDLPLSREAREFYKSGRPYLYRHLPFWLAGAAERLLILLIPLFAVVFPLAHYLPTIYALVIEHRIFKLYGQLKVVETKLEVLGPGEAVDDLATALEELVGRANHLRVPLHFTQRLFILKEHIVAAQQQVEKRRGKVSGGGTP